MAHDAILSREPFSDPTILRIELERLDRLWYLLDEGMPPFHELGDPRRTLGLLRSTDASVSADEFLQLCHSLMGMRSIHKWFHDRARQGTELLPVAGRIVPRSDLEEAITAIIDPTGKVRDDASTELRKIRRELLRLDGTLRDTIERTLREWSSKKYLQEELITIRDGHYVLPVLATYRHRVSGVAQDTQ